MTTYFGAFNRGEWQPGRQEHVENIRMQDLARGLQQWIAEQQLNQGQQRIGLEQQGLGLQQQGIGLQERGLTQRGDIANQELALRGRDLTRLEGDSAANNATNAEKMNMTKQEFAQWLAGAPSRKALEEANIRRAQAEADSAYNEAHPPQMPDRVVGQTTDADGNTTYTLTDGKGNTRQVVVDKNMQPIKTVFVEGYGTKNGIPTQAPAGRRYQEKGTFGTDNYRMQSPTDKNNIWYDPRYDVWGNRFRSMGFVRMFTDNVP